MFRDFRYWSKFLVGRMFANGPGDQRSIPGWVIPKTQNMILDTSLLNTQPYKVWIKAKWSNPGKEVAPFPTPWCSSYWKGSFWVALNYGRPSLLIHNWYSYLFRRCPWCNGYHRRKWTQQHEFKSWTRLIAFHIALIPLGKVWIQLFFLQLWVTSWVDWVL